MSFSTLVTSLVGRFGLYLTTVLVASIVGRLVFPDGGGGLGLFIFILMLLVPSVVVAALIDRGPVAVAVIAGAFLVVLLWAWSVFGVADSSTSGLVFVLVAMLALPTAAGAVILNRIIELRRRRGAPSDGPVAGPPSP